MKIQTKSVFFILLLCLFMFIHNGLNGAHLVGGDATYEFVRFNADSTEVTFRINFNLYRDRIGGGAELDRFENFGVYRQLPDGSWVSVQSFNAIRGQLEIIPGIDEPCREEPPPSVVSVETARYQETITLPVIDQNYLIAYQRCCRNDGINNIFGDETGAVVDLLISPLAQRTGNNSPTFNEFPPIFICAGFPINVSQQCTDTEGDEIRYSFCTPLSAGSANFNPTNLCDSPVPDPDSCPPPFEEVVFRPGFSNLAPLAGNPVVQINSTSGLITGTPEVGGLYIISVCVEEFRNGELLSTLRRDFQFNALTCIKELSADLIADEQIIDNSTSTLPINIIKACGDSIVNFSAIDNNSTIINYHWIVFDPDGNMVVDTSGNNTRNINVVLDELGEYEGTLSVLDSEGCTDTARLRVLRLPDLESDFSFETLDTCYLDAIRFTDASFAEASEVVRWAWELDGEEVLTEPNITFEFTERGIKEVSLIVEDRNTCIDTFTQFIDYDPPLDSLLTDDIQRILCFGDSIFFGNRWLSQTGFYSDTVVNSLSGCDSLHTFLSLDFHEEPRSTFLDTILCPGQTVDYFGVVYSEAGSHFHTTESLTSFDEFVACDSLLHFLELSFETQPEIIFGQESDFVIANRDYAFPLRINGEYEFADWTPSTGLDCDQCTNPILNGEIDTTYILTLTTEINCIVRDSFFVDFVVVPESYYFPNIINSNTIDQRDRAFYLQTQENAIGEVEYDLRVYDRWGGLVFEGLNLDINDNTVGWNPNNNLSIGSYVYTIEVREFFETRQFSGTITLTR